MGSLSDCGGLAVLRQTRLDVELVVLLDGVVLNEHVLRALPAWNRLSLSGIRRAKHRRLLQSFRFPHGRADVLVLLEVGRTGRARLARPPARRTRLRSA